MRLRFLLIFVLALTLTPLTWAAQPGLRIYTENLPPFNIATQTGVSGIATDTLVALFANIGKPIDPTSIEAMPWARAYQLVQTEPSTVLYSTMRTEERETMFAWVGPIERLTIGVVARKDRNIVIREASDMEHYLIGTIRNGAPEQLLLKAGLSGTNFDPISDQKNNLKKLLSGRIDLFAFLVPTAQYLLRDMGLDPDAIELVYTLKKGDLYYAFHKETDPALIQALQDALKALKKTGPNKKSEFDAIAEKYMGDR